MKIYPAIDIKDGRCVRLIQGDYNKVIDYSEDPIEVARAWEAAGAEWLHVVDLDGARSGIPRNRQIILDIRKQVGMHMQVGGGLRTIESLAELLDNGIDRVAPGTAALNDPALMIGAIHRWPGRIAVSLDARDGLVTADGWLTTSQQTPKEVMLSLAGYGVGTFIYTDIARDGMLGGPNMESLAELLAEAHRAGVELIASGGVASLDDIYKLAAIGADGVIIGRALYTGAVDLAQALEAAKGRQD